MQKILTVSIDTLQIQRPVNTPFAIQEVEMLNEWLALGWQIDEWEFLKKPEADGNIILLVILSDDAIYNNDDFDDEFESDNTNFNEETDKLN